MFSIFWQKLAFHKDSIDALAKIIQTAIIIAGAYFAYNEFVLNDARLERERTERTLNYGTRLHSEEFAEHDRRLTELYKRYEGFDVESFEKENPNFVGEYMEIRRPIEDYFSTLNVLVGAEVVDHSLLCWLGGYHAHRYASRLSDFLDDREIWLWEDPADIGFNPLSTTTFCSNCANAGYFTGAEPIEYGHSCRRGL